MEIVVNRRHAAFVDGNRSTPQLESLVASAHALQRAAGDLLKHGDGAQDTATLAVTLASVEEALDRLEVAMHKFAHAASRDGGSVSGDEADPLGAEREALAFHLRLAADRLREPQLACQAARSWTRRLLETPIDPHEDCAWPPPGSDGGPKAPEPDRASSR